MLTLPQWNFTVVYTLSGEAVPFLPVAFSNISMSSLYEFFILQVDRAGAAGTIQLAAVRCPSSQSQCRLCMNILYCRCDRAGAAGTIRLAAVRCPSSLAFDIDRQTCDWKAKVTTCDKLSSKFICQTNQQTTN